jgi:hypothetical protein
VVMWKVGEYAIGEAKRSSHCNFIACIRAWTIEVSTGG